MFNIEFVLFRVCCLSCVVLIYTCQQWMLVNILIYLFITRPSILVIVGSKTWSPHFVICWLFSLSDVIVLVIVRVHVPCIGLSRLTDWLTDWLWIRDLGFGIQDSGFGIRELEIRNRERGTRNQESGIKHVTKQSAIRDQQQTIRNRNNC